MNLLATPIGMQIARMRVVLDELGGDGFPPETDKLVEAVVIPPMFPELKSELMLLYWDWDVPVWGWALVMMVPVAVDVDPLWRSLLDPDEARFDMDTELSWLEPTVLAKANKKAM